MVYICGSLIRIIETNSHRFFDFVPNHVKEDPSNGICLLAVSPTLNKIAFSETKQNAPNVFIYNVTRRGSIEVTFTEQTRLKEGALLEYSAVEFSNSDAILTLSGVPDVHVIVWSSTSGNRITSIDLNMNQPLGVSFSPLNWRHICVAYQNELNVWNIEQCNSKLLKTSKTRFAMPVTREQTEEASLAIKDEFKYPTNAIAALNSNNADILEEVLDKRVKHKYKCHCWTNNSEILVGTEENDIYLFSLADSTVKCVYEFMRTRNLTDEASNNYDITEPNSIKFLYMHRLGLFIGSTVKLSFILYYRYHLFNLKCFYLKKKYFRMEKCDLRCY